VAYLLLGQVPTFRFILRRDGDVTSDGNGDVNVLRILVRRRSTWYLVGMLNVVASQQLCLDATSGH